MSEPGAPAGRPAWVVPVLSAVLALLVGVALTLVLLREDGDDDQAAPPVAPRPSRPSASASTSPSAPPSPAASTAAPSAPAGRTVDFRGIVLTLPDGWSVGEEGDATLCLTRTDECELSVLLTDAAIEASGGAFELPDPESQYGWYTGTDVPGGCDDRDIADSERVERSTRPVGDRTADYAVWQVTCPGGDYPERPRLWWLPRTGLAFFDDSDDPAAEAAVDEIVRTADISAVAAPR
jgi:hypothetical protein